MSDGARTPGAIGVAAPVPHSEALYVMSVPSGLENGVWSRGSRELAREVVRAGKDLQATRFPRCMLAFNAFGPGSVAGRPTRLLEQERSETLVATVRA